MIRSVIFLVSAHEEIAAELRESVGKIQQILNSLAQPLQHDLRSEFEKPVFKRGVTSMADLKVGQKLDGVYLFFVCMSIF